MVNTNSLLNLNWIAFLSLLLVIGAARISIKKLLPISPLSITTAVTVGFVVFLGFGVLGYSESIYLPASALALLVVLAYISFLFGAVVIQFWMGKKLFIKNLSLPSKAMAQIALILVTLYTILAVIQFLRNGGISGALDLFLGGYAHREYLAQLNSLQSLSNGGIDAFLENIIQGIFLCFWIVGFSRFPRFSILLYGFSVLPIFGSYTSRSQLLGQVVVPLLAYYSFFRPSRQILIMQLSIFVLAVLVFFSWNSAIRLGHNYDASLEHLISDTLRDGGNSVEPATAILAWNWRGFPLDYLVSLISFPIPRSIWPDKPLLLYNVEITYLFSGAWPGVNNPIVTSTMLGEAWYYFGIAGTFILMAFFGAYAQLMELMLSRTIWTLGVYYMTVYLSFVLVRSTFLTYYQNGISFLVAAGVTLLLSSAIYYQLNQHTYQVRLRKHSLSSTLYD